jgi:cyanophycin synthetase
VAPPRADLVELRILDGPNLYFPRPAVKLTIGVGGWLDVPEERLSAAMERAGASGRPGRPRSDQRRRTVARLAARLTSRLASTSGVRLAVRSRPGPEPEQVVVAFPWRRRGAAEALGQEVASLLDAAGGRTSIDRLVAEAAGRVATVEPGDEPNVPDPDTPVVSVTGTNGKTTTVRLIAHIVRSAGRSVAYSSTDGVYRGDGDLIEEGDYSGFGGAARALAEEADVAVLETARGGILLRGIGVLHNDVAIVTNVSEDHLGLHGIQTIDQLAEVKATVTRITRPDGWDVLNADDPRVLSMRRVATGRPWLCSLDPGHPAIRDALAERGRATIPLDGWMTVLDGSSSHPLVELTDVPVTIAGISRHNVMNAMQAASAAIGIGLLEHAVVRGLKTFVTDPDRNPGRANLFQLDGRVILVDYAHNEAGMMGFTQMCDGLRRGGAEIWLVICAAGDRTDEILHGFAYRAARVADHVAIAELLRYLRGRDREDVFERLVAGARDGGATEVDVYADELAGLRGVFARSKRGDVIGVTALGMRGEVFAWLEEARAQRLTPARVKQVVRRANAERDAPARRRR